MSDPITPPNLASTTLIGFAPFGHPDRNWPEDAPHENGNYICACYACKQTFVGHKRRVQCRKCATTEAERWNALTPAQQVNETHAAYMAMTRWVDEQDRLRTENNT